MGEAFAGTAESGPLVLAIAVSAIAGLVSFLSPCVLPLVPGYLSYVTGLAGADLVTPPSAGASTGVSVGPVVQAVAARDGCWPARCCSSPGSARSSSPAV